MNEITQLLHIDPLLLQALREDIPEEDVSTNAVMPHACPGTVDLIAKEDGIVAGLAVYARVFTLLDPGAKVEFFCRDGDTVQPGQKLAVVTGDIRALLSGERVALNYLQRMSGIATYTHQLSALLEGTGITLLDTRKTSPNNRIFEKYAVRVGGGSNHRTGLSDGVLLKDNHIGAAGGVAKAVKMARQYASFVRKIEVETENLDMVREAVEAGADMIDTAMSPFSMGTSQPATEVMVETFKGTPYDTGLDQEKLAEIADYFRPMREEALKSGLMNTKVLGVDINTLRYQVPGGMLSNLVSQLKEARAEDKYYDVLKEIPRVRKDFGEPPLVTPSSQIVGTQAVLNVLMGERYKMFTKESKKLLMGEFGQTVKPFDKEVQKKAIGDAKPITCRPADLIEPQLEKIEAEMKQWKQQDEDVLTYALFPQVAKEFFESRPAKKPPVEKREILKAAAPEVKKAPVSTEEMDGNGINTWAGRKSESYQI